MKNNQGNKNTGFTDDNRGRKGWTEDDLGRLSLSGNISQF